MLGRPSVHFGNSPSGLRHPKCFTLVLGRLPGFSHGMVKVFDVPKPRTSPERPYALHSL